MHYPALIELHVPDFERARQFYGELGFAVVREEPVTRGAGYLVMRLEENTLCFWGGSAAVFQHDYFGRYPANTPPGFGVEIVLQVSNVGEFYQRLNSRVEVLEALRERPWGLADFRLRDPFGFYLRITSKHDPAADPADRS